MYEEKKKPFESTLWKCPWCSEDFNDGVFLGRKEVIPSLSKALKQYEKEPINLKGKTQSLAEKFSISTQEFLEDTILYLEKKYRHAVIPICSGCALDLQIKEKTVSSARNDSQVDPNKTLHYLSACKTPPNFLFWLDQAPELYYFLAGPENRKRAWLQIFDIEEKTIIKYRNWEVDTRLKLEFEWFELTGIFPDEYLVNMGPGYILTNYRAVNIRAGTIGPQRKYTYSNDLYHYDVGFWYIYNVPFIGYELKDTDDTQASQHLWNFAINGNELNNYILLTSPPPKKQPVDKSFLQQIFENKDWEKLDTEAKEDLESSGSMTFIKLIAPLNSEQFKGVETYWMKAIIPDLIKELTSSDPRYLAVAESRIVNKIRYMFTDPNPNLNLPEVRAKHIVSACACCAQKVTEGQLFLGVIASGFLKNRISRLKKEPDLQLPDQASQLLDRFGLPESRYLELQMLWVDDINDVPICISCKNRLGISDEQWIGHGRPLYREFIDHNYKSSTNFLYELIAAPSNYEPFAYGYYKEMLQNRKITKVWGTKLDKKQEITDKDITAATWMVYFERLRTPILRWGARNIDILEGEELRELDQDRVILTNYRIRFTDFYRDTQLVGRWSIHRKFAYTIPLTNDNIDYLIQEKGYAEKGVLEKIKDEGHWEKLSDENKKNLWHYARIGLVHGAGIPTKYSKIKNFNEKLIPTILDENQNLMDARYRDFWDSVAIKIYQDNELYFGEVPDKGLKQAGIQVSRPMWKQLFSPF